MMKKILLVFIYFSIIHAIVNSFPASSSSPQYYEPQEPFPVTHNGGIYDPVVQVDLDLSAGVPGQDIPGLGKPAPSGGSGYGGGSGGGGGNNGGTNWWNWWFNLGSGNPSSGQGNGGGGSGGTNWWSWWLTPIINFWKFILGFFFPGWKS